jgi:hypothetical protein
MENNHAKIKIDEQQTQTVKPKINRIQIDILNKLPPKCAQQTNVEEIFLIEIKFYSHINGNNFLKKTRGNQNLILKKVPTTQIFKPNPISYAYNYILFLLQLLQNIDILILKKI